MASKPPLIPPEGFHEPDSRWVADNVARPATGKTVPSLPASVPAGTSHGHHRFSPDAVRKSLAPIRPSMRLSVQHDDNQRNRNGFVIITVIPSWLASGLLHMVIFILLALLYVPLSPVHSFTEILVGREENSGDSEELFQEGIEFSDIAMYTEESRATAGSRSFEFLEELKTIPAAGDLEVGVRPVQLREFGEETAPKYDLLALVNEFSGSGLSGRADGERERLVREAGGTPASEAAVARALKWFATHQNNNGAWNYNHQQGTCQGRCDNPGVYHQARIAATSMALLPFLGAGQTHTEGEYQPQVRQGIYFLIGSMERRNGYLGGLWEPEGRMYSHCLAAIVLCEAYGMTRDEDLAEPAQMALNYLMWAQITGDGGWRYLPQDPTGGDTSVVGWALMALKSGQMAYLKLNPHTFRNASSFLDRVQTSGGAGYGYRFPEATPTVTAIGLLCRMYLGWEKEHAALRAGVEALSAQGPDRSDMYYNYYTTQVMRHFGGEHWTHWNEKMRDYLVTSQATSGHEEGSWFFINPLHNVVPTGNLQGGRLYCTSLATMILEVYYRHMPIYRTQAVEDEFLF